MKVVIESIGKVGSKAIVGAHELVFDQPTNAPGGEDRGPPPLDVLSVSVGACAHDFAAAYLHGRGLVPEGLRWMSRPESRRFRCVSPAGLEERHVAGVERAIKSCPAYGTRRLSR
jgi:uncharacterized OsmC-like protein